MLLKLFIIFVISLVLIQNANTARILAYIPTAAYSHQVFFQQYWRALAIRGHEMVVITSDPTGEKLSNLKEISIKETYTLVEKYRNLLINETIFTLIMFNKLNQITCEAAELQLSLPQIKEIITNKSEHFDLFVVEHSAPVQFAFKHRFNCPMIGVLSMDVISTSHSAIGNPVHSILYPLAMFPFHEDLSLIQRIVAVLFANLFELQRYISAPQYDEVVRKHFGHNVPSVIDLVDQLEMLFVNANPLFNVIRPFTPSTISLAGGIHMKPEKPLPKDLRQFLDNAKKGAIFFSLGTNVKSNDITLEKRQIIMDTLSQLPYQVLWKVEDDTLPGKPDNVKITKWAPQQDVLRHKNIKLFITQGGIQSLEEALYSHVPVVTIPFFGDQQANAEKVKSKGLGVILDRHNLNVDNFKAAILEVIENPKYKNNVKMLATRIQDEPMKPLEKAVWWTEYVLRHGGAKHLKGPRIPTYQYYYVDIIGLLSLIVVLFVGLIYGLLKLIGMIVKYFVTEKKLKKM